MRSLSNVIKPFQYTSLTPRRVDIPPLPAQHAGASPAARRTDARAASGENGKSFSPEKAAAGDESAARQAEGESAAAELLKPADAAGPDEAGEEARGQRKKLLRESMRRMNEECARMHERFRRAAQSEGFAKGRAEGLEQGRAEGRLEGRKQGLEEARDACRPLLDELSRLAEETERQKKEILSRYTDGLGGLAVDIARKIVQKELAEDDEAVRAIVENAARAYRNQEWLKICVSPENSRRLLAQEEALKERLRDVSEDVTIVPRRELENDDVRLEMPDRLVFAGVEVQLQRIREALAI